MPTFYEWLKAQTSEDVHWIVKEYSDLNLAYMAHLCEVDY